MATSVLVFGCGRVGKTMAVDLAEDFEVSVTDFDPSAYEGLPDNVRRLGFIGPTPEMLRPYDVVVSAVPGARGYRMLQRIVEAGKDVVDISFFPQDARLLEPLVKQHGVVAAVDCGVAPGLWNMVLGHAEETVLRVDRATCYVGGLPRVRTWPYGYKAPFSPADVIEEYIRPARYLENREIVTKAALSDAHLVDLPHVGTLEAFRTDGLRTLLEGMKTPSISEYTLRWPGHVELMRVLRETGFFSDEYIELEDDSHVRPRDVAAHLLFKQWEFDEDEEDLTVMRIVLDVWERDPQPERGAVGVPVTETHDLYDVRDDDGVMSMARTTGYTATGVVRALARGTIPRPGLYAPEQLGAIGGCYSEVMSHLRSRGVSLVSTREEMPRRGDDPP